MGIARTRRALVAAFLAAHATAALATYFDPVQTYSSIPTTSAGFANGDRHYGQGVAVPDGRVIYPPALGTYVGIYDPSTNTFAPNVSLAISGSYKYYTAAPLLDGRACFVPYWAEQVTVFDPATNGLEHIPIPTAHRSDQKKYIGGATANDGRGVMAPALENGVGVFDPDAKTFVKYDFDPLPAPAGTFLYQGAAKAGNGKIVFAPYSTVVPVGIFDPSTNTFYTLPHGAASVDPLVAVVFNGAAAAYGGRVVLAPYYADSIGVYDPVSDEVTLIPHNRTDRPFFDAAPRAYDGKVIFAPYNVNEFGIFDARDNALSWHPLGDAYLGKTSMFWMATAANATRILFTGRTSVGYELGVFDATCGAAPKTMLQSTGSCFDPPPCTECCHLRKKAMGLNVPCA